MFTGIVQTSFMYILNGSSVLSPILKATPGEVGVTSASNFRKASVNSRLMSVLTC